MTSTMPSPASTTADMDEALSVVIAASSAINVHSRMVPQLRNAVSPLTSLRIHSISISTKPRSAVAAKMARAMAVASSGLPNA